MHARFRPVPTTTRSRSASVALVSLLVALAFACTDEPEGSPGSAVTTELAYVRSDACVECHADIHAAWSGSHHDRAMETATEKTVLGDFDGATFETSGESYRFVRVGDAYRVSVTSPDGTVADYDVRYTFGVEPLQQYLVDFPGGRLQCLTVAWDTENGRWFTLYPDEDIPSGDPFHWTGRYQNWNTMCAACHSTALVKGYDRSTDTYATTWEDLDVGCEACHGPGSGHVAWARADAAERDDDPDRGWTRPLRRGDAEAMIDACAPCHSRRNQLIAEVTPGTPFLDAYQPQRLGAGLYFADGQILEEVYVYGSFVQSKMHRAGVTCTDCHDAHSLELVQEDNALCTQCHTPYAPLERFPQLQQKVYDGPEHHFHPADSTGASCVACHMPERTYMVVDPRRDHSFRVPRPALAAAVGAPDACTACHTDQTQAWAAERIVEWYGPRPDEPHFGRALAAARAGEPGAGEQLARVAGDVDQAAIVRATALEALAPWATTEAGARVLVEAVRDPDPLVRSSAASALEAFPPPERVTVLAELLTDELRSVRIEAARSLSSAPMAGLPPQVSEPFEAALEEYRAVQREGADMPWSHLNLGRLAAVRGNPSAAEASYRRALALDPGFLPARFNLSHLLNGEGRNDEAERLLRAGLERTPEEGELHYSLGLLLGEMERPEEAADELVEASRRLPRRPRVHYNAGLALAAVGRREEAAAALYRAHRLVPGDADTLYALVTFHLEGGQPEEALDHARRLVELVPDAEGPRRLLEDIERRLEGGAGG